MESKHLLTLFVPIVCIALFSCTPNEPKNDVTSEPQSKINDAIEVTAENCLTEMLRYFPNEVDTTYTYINDSTGHQWRITPNLKIMGFDDFPHVTSSSNSYGGWRHTLSACFDMENVNNRYYTYASSYMYIISDIPQFDVGYSNYIAIDSVHRYNAIFDTTLDSVSLSVFFTDTLSIPFTTAYFDLNVGREDKEYISMPPPAGAIMHFIKDQGLVDFSVDGKSFYHRK